MNRLDFQRLAEVRLAEAQALLACTLPHPSGAYYLAGYAVECALKACICKQYEQHDWPEKSHVADCHTHEILKLVKLANLADSRDLDARSMPILANNWLLVQKWNERYRYMTVSLTAARELIRAVEGPEYGVLPWIKARW